MIEESKTVWIVTYWVPEETIIAGVFAAEELAKKWLRKHKGYYYELDSHEVIDEG